MSGGVAGGRRGGRGAYLVGGRDNRGRSKPNLGGNPSFVRRSRKMEARQAGMERYERRADRVTRCHREFKDQIHAESRSQAV